MSSNTYGEALKKALGEESKFTEPSFERSVSSSRSVARSVPYEDTLKSSEDHPDLVSAATASTTSESGGADKAESDPLPPKRDEEAAEEVASDEDSAAAEKSESNLERMIVNDVKGRSKELEVDFSNRDQIKKYISDRFNFEKGMRQMQVERDKLKSENSTFSEEAKLYRNMDKAYESEGILGLIDVVEGQGQPGYHKKWLEEQLARRDFMQTANPDQLRNLELEERLVKIEKEALRDKREKEGELSRIRKEREELEQKQLDSLFLPSVERYSFEGKLGDTEIEETFNATLFEKVRTNLSKKMGDGSELELTPQLIDAEFKDIYSRMQKQIGQQVETKTKKAIVRKKREATEAVQSQVRSGIKSDLIRDEQRSMVRQGKLAALFSRL